MQKLSNGKLLQIITKVLVLILLAKFISLALWWFLPSNGIEMEEENSYTQSYKRIDFKNMLERSQVVVSEQKQTAKAISIDTIILNGLYGKGKHGYAIVAKKAFPKNTSVISVGEVYEGYRLKTIKLESVVFEKSGKEYILTMSENEAVKASVRESRVERDVTAGGVVGVQKTDINFYRSNPTKIWKDIAINEIKEGKKIKGFRVDRVKKGSKIAELGLKKGDIIIRANNVELTSYKAVMDIYRKIDTIDTVNLVVMRNNQEKEIIYEVR